MRKLASIQKIVDIRPIDGADKIEVAQVLGWEVVVAKKDEFKVGDLVIYIEIDSIVPDKSEFDFLRDRKFRVRTIKLRKQVSQGLILPLSILPSKY
jgi:RNA ligase (TIGR02306 family)